MKIMTWCEDHFPQSGADIHCSQGKGGTLVNFVGVAQGAGGGIHAYKGSNASEGGTPKVRITPGTHNGITPTISGVPMTTVPRPVLTLGASDKIVYVQLNLNSVTAAIQTAIIASSASLTPPAGDSLTVYQILFFTTVSIIEGAAFVAVSPNVSGSQAYQSCGGQNLFGLI